VTSTAICLAGSHAASEIEGAGAREFVLLGAYFSAVVLATDILNVRLGVELLTVTVFLAALVISRRAVAFLRDWWFLLVGLVMWNLSGPIAGQSPFPRHLDFMLEIDRWLSLGHEPVASLQHHLTHGPQLQPLDWVTAFAYNLHLSEPYIAGYFLWRLNRAIYFQFAAAALTLLVVGFVTFIVFPAIPPWFASMRLHRLADVTNRFNLVVHAHPLPFHGTPIFYVFRFAGDAVAAFPSEHAAFPLLEFLAFRAAVGRKALPLLLWVAFVLFTVVYLGEHWVTDVLAGWIYALVIFAIIHRLATGKAPGPLRSTQGQRGRD
jgi:membrane-associated phospholipid phosphatase